jgi:hypothetical protein
MDFVGPLPDSGGHNLILVVVDRLTKMSHFIPTKSTITSKDLYTLFKDHIFRLHGFPDDIVSDRGTLFSSKFWLSFTDLLGIKAVMSTAHHQETNGQSERVIQCLKEYLRMFINYRQDDWIDYIALAEFAYNNAVHSSIGISPFKANYGYDFSVGGVSTSNVSDENNTVPAAHAITNQLHDVHERLKVCIVKAQEAQKRFADRLRAQMPNFVIGAKVWLKTTNLVSDRPSKKLDYKYAGPFEILEQVNDVSFRLKLPREMKVHDVFHVSLLEVHEENTIPGRYQKAPPTVLLKGDDGEIQEEYEIESILAKRKRRRKTEYLVHWRGYGIEDRTWEPACHFKNAPQLLKDFEQRC